MIAVDSQLLVYAYRQDSEWHDESLRALVGLAQSGRTWAIPWPCVHEFLAIVTRPHYYEPPSTIAGAIDAIEAWTSSGTLVFLAEGQLHWDYLRKVALKARVRGAKIHDAKIAAICLANAVSEFWTADADFLMFPELPVRNPLARKS